MAEEIECIMGEDGELRLVEKGESKVSFYLDEETIFNFLKAIKNNKEVGDLIEAAPISVDGVGDDFLVRLQSLE